MPAVRDVLARLAQRTLAGSSVPDLGPAMVVAQLAVLTYDVCRSDPAYPILDELSALRRALTSPTRPDLGHRV